MLGIGPVLDERTRDEEPRSGDFPLLDPRLNVEHVLERRSELPREGDSAREQLARGRRHDFPPEARSIRRVPVLVVAVAEDHEMDVHVRETGNHGHPARVDGRRARRHGHGAARAHGDDPLPRNEDDAVLDGSTLVTIDDAPAHQRQSHLWLILGPEQGRQAADQKQAHAEQEPSEHGGNPPARKYPPCP